MIEDMGESGVRTDAVSSMLVQKIHRPAISERESVGENFGRDMF
jgi:hypothetical protein